jgi:hypothetical protein
MRTRANDSINRGFEIHMTGSEVRRKGDLAELKRRIYSAFSQVSHTDDHGRRYSFVHMESKRKSVGLTNSYTWTYMAGSKKKIISYSDKQTSSSTKDSVL